MRKLAVIIMVIMAQVSFAGIYKTDTYNGYLGGVMATGDKVKYRNEDNKQIYDLYPGDFAKFTLGMGIEYERNKCLSFPINIESFGIGNKEYSGAYVWIRDGKSRPVNDKVSIYILALTSEARYKFNRKDKGITPYLGLGTGIYWEVVNLEYDHYYETGGPDLYILWKERKQENDNNIDLGFHISSGILFPNKFFIEGRYRILNTNIGEGLSYSGFQINLGKQL